MARPSTKTPEEKLRVVLAVLRGELSAADAGRRNGVAEQTIHNWKKAFLDAGRAPAFVSGARARSRERRAQSCAR
jgi:transposase